MTLWTWLAPSRFTSCLCLVLSAPWLVHALLTMNLLIYPTVGQTMLVPTLTTLTLYCLHRLLASHPIQIFSHRLCIHVIWFKLLYNMTLLPSDAHSKVLKTQHCKSLSVLCCALILLLLMKSGNVHAGPSTVTSPNSDLCYDYFCFTDFCSRKSLGLLYVNTRSFYLKCTLDKLGSFCFCKIESAVQDLKHNTFVDL